MLSTLCFIISAVNIISFVMSIIVTEYSFTDFTLFLLMADVYSIW